MRTYVTVHSFEYARDKYGKPYGRGIPRYAVAEGILGVGVTLGAYDCSPEESKARIVQHYLTDEGLVNAGGRSKSASFTDEGMAKVLKLLKQYGIENWRVRLTNYL